MSTFAELQNLVKERVGIASANPADAAIGVANTGALANLVKAAVRRIEVAKPAGWYYLRKTFTLTLTPNVSTYTFGGVSFVAGLTGIAKIVEIRLSTPSVTPSETNPLPRVSRTEADMMFPTPASMTPQVWWTEGEELGFTPAPDGAYTVQITVIQTERELVNGTDVPLMPTRFHDAIVEKAAELWFRRVHNIADAQVAAGAAADWIRTMLAAERPYAGAGRVVAGSR